MEKIIVYGLGNDWILNSKIIEENFDIVGYYDKNIERMKYNPLGINNISELRDKKERILIVSSCYWREIYNECISYGIEEERLIVYDELDIKKLHWNKKTIGGVTYSGDYEDLLIDCIIRRLGIKYCDMKYIELGVMDPIISSNTYYFYKRGAKGILVEANPSLINRIKRIRPKDYIINKAIYDKDNSVIPFYVSNEPGLSSVVENHLEGIEEWKKIGIEKKINVETVNINTVLAQLSSIDLMSIDLEGYDLTALRMMQFDKYRPKVLIVELNWFDVTGRHQTQEIVDLLYENGYSLYYQNDYNGIFVDEKTFNESCDMGNKVRS